MKKLTHKTKDMVLNAIVGHEATLFANNLILLPSTIITSQEGRDIRGYDLVVNSSIIHISGSNYKAKDLIDKHSLLYTAGTRSSLLEAIDKKIGEHKWLRNSNVYRFPLISGDMLGERKVGNAILIPFNQKQNTKRYSVASTIDEHVEDMPNSFDRGTYVLNGMPIGYNFHE